MKNLAIIPARSGSKGLKDKNIMPLNNHPLLSYSINSAINSGCFDTIMVSTDSQKYADIAIKYGAEVPFLRSALLSGDTSGSWDAVREVLSMYSDLGKTFDTVTLLQPTSPLRSSIDIQNCYAMYNGYSVNAVVAVVEVDHPIQLCFRMNNNNSMDELANSPYRDCRRQDLDVFYRENGAIYLVDAKKIMSSEYNVYMDNCHGYIMPKERSIDIDCKLDFDIAEIILKNSI